MADGTENLAQRVEAVEGRLEELSVSVATRFDQMDRRFDETKAALVEQRQYTEFAYDQLVVRMDAGFARVDERFTQMDARFARIERKLDQVIDRFLPPEPRA